MRHICQAAILYSFLACLAQAEPETIHWYKDLDQASSAAREANKPMLIDFWADWCAPCRVMEKEVYADPVVVELASKKFLPVQLDFDRQQNLARKYNIAGLPTIVFTDSSGGELVRHAGIIDAKTLAELLKALPGDVTEINRLRQVLAQDKDNFSALSGLANNLRAAGLFRSSNDYYTRALRTDAARRDLPLTEQLLTTMGQNLLELQESKEAVKVFERCLKEFPASGSKPVFLLGLGQAYALANEKAKARKPLATIVSQYPNSEAARKAAEILKTLR